MNSEDKVILSEEILDYVGAAEVLKVSERVLKIIAFSSDLPSFVSTRSPQVLKDLFFIKSQLLAIKHDGRLNFSMLSFRHLRTSFNDEIISKRRYIDGGYRYVYDVDQISDLLGVDSKTVLALSRFVRYWSKTSKYFELGNVIEFLRECPYIDDSRVSLLLSEGEAKRYLGLESESGLWTWIKGEWKWRAILAKERLYFLPELNLMKDALLNQAKEVKILAVINDKVFGNKFVIFRPHGNKDAMSSLNLNEFLKLLDSGSLSRIEKKEFNVRPKKRLVQ